MANFHECIREQILNNANFLFAQHRCIEIKFFDRTNLGYYIIRAHLQDYLLLNN